MAHRLHMRIQGRHEGQTNLGDDVLFGAGEPRQEVQHRHRLCFSLGGQVDGKLHVTVEHIAVMAENLSGSQQHVETYMPVLV